MACCNSVALSTIASFVETVDHAMDDLLDLDFASANKPIHPTKPSPQAHYGPGRTAFDYLASQPPRQATAPPVRATTPLNPAKPQPKPAAASASTGGDAFAELFGSSSSAASSTPPLNGSTMAERLQRESAAKLAGYGGPPSRSGTHSPLAGLSSTLSPQSRSACALASYAFLNERSLNWKD